MVLREYTLGRVRRMYKLRTIAGDEVALSLDNPLNLLAEINNELREEDILKWAKQNDKSLQLARCLGKLGTTKFYLTSLRTGMAVDLLLPLLSEKLPAKVIAKLLKVCAFCSVNDSRVLNQRIRRFATKYLGKEDAAYDFVLQKKRKTISPDLFLETFKDISKEFREFLRSYPYLFEGYLERLTTASEKETNSIVGALENIFEEGIKESYPNTLTIGVLIKNKRVVLTKKTVELRLKALLNGKWIAYCHKFLDAYLRQYRPEFVKKNMDYVDKITVQVIQKGDKKNKAAIQSAVKRVNNPRTLVSLFTHTDQVIRKIAKQTIKKGKAEFIYEALKQRVKEEVDLNWEEILSTEIYELLTSKEF